MKPASLFKALLTSALLVSTTSTLAHHSYADYVRNERTVFSGTISDVKWANPHVILTVSNDNEDMRIEWVAAQRASLNGVNKEQLAVGDQVTITGSRNRIPEQQIMTLIKELEVPEKNLHWISSSLARAR